MKNKARRFAGKVVMLFCFNILFALPGFARDILTPVVRIKNTVIRFDNSNEWITNYTTNGAIKTEPMQVVVLFKTLPTPAEKIILEKNGIRLLNYLPENAYLAWVLLTVNINAAKYFNGIKEVSDEWKVENTLWQQLKTERRELGVTVSFYKGVEEQVIQNKIAALGGAIINDRLKSVGVYNIIMTPGKIKELVSWYGVEHINPIAGAIPQDITTVNTHKANALRMPLAFGGNGLSGAGVTIGVGDNTSAIYHPDMRDRVINYNPVAEATHGIHTAGIATSAGIVDPEAEGMAPGATVVTQIYSAIWEETPGYYTAHNMTYTNNSYAAYVQNCAMAGTYDDNSAALDKYALEYDKVIHVFAGGNDGNLTCPPYPEGFSAISGSYQPAKNNIVVSSIDRYYLNREVTSASGPVKDGRLKPELSAVGAFVYSGDKNQGYTHTLGTSQASPQVTGGLALLAERYKLANSGAQPTAVLLKGILLNGTTDVGIPGPDFTNGFGALNMHRALRILDNKQYSTDAVGNNAQKQTTITVPANTAQLKVMLTWHDAPASPIASKALVNDLDLEVTTPNGTVRLPLVLDPAADKVKQPATEKVDRLNNVEQVVIDNPAAGNYTFTVKGFNVPSATQSYVITYHFIPPGVRLTFPSANSDVKANDTAFVYWEASDDANSFQLSYSTDNGTNWNLLDANIPASQRYYVWNVPNISAGSCKMMIRRNNTTEENVTGTFVISLQQVLRLEGAQCPGYMHVSWDAVPNATSYQVMRKLGPAMSPVDTVTGTDYTFKGLDLDSTYYAAVRPMFLQLQSGNTMLHGYRSVAVSRKPDNGNCAGSISDGDLMIEDVIKPTSVRQFTTGANNNDSVTIVVRNLDDVACNNFRVWYDVNGANPQSQTFTTSLNPNQPVTIVITGLSLPQKSNNLRIAIENLATTDPVTSNDTVYRTVTLLNNAPINLVTTPYVDGFEDMPAFTLSKDSMGVAPNEHWDYHTTNLLGRIRSYVHPGITLNGNRSISMDAIQSTSTLVQNELTGTFNLQLPTSTEVRLEFSYLLHGLPRARQNNGVFVRGNDQDAWIKVYNYNNSLLQYGRLQSSGSISLSDALAEAGKTFTSSTQIMFVQADTSVLSLVNFGTGMTMDDVNLYTVSNDMQVVSVVSPDEIECGVKKPVPLVVNLYNGVSNALSNVKISYRLDGGEVITETLAFIDAKAEFEYTFNKQMDLLQTGLHTIDLWVEATGDNYHKNDSIMNFKLRNQPLITSYPYLETLENGDGYWYASGQRNSWEYGVPASAKINTAGSGTKVWKTNLDGNYNNLETSYLYSPCFDLTTVKKPVFRMNSVMDIEDCGEVLCDALYVEYSSDGEDWKRLGEAGKGENWYNKVYNVWSIQDRTAWQRSRIAMPDDLGLTRIRFVMNTDIGVVREGVALDDLEIFESAPANNLVEVYPNPVKGGTFNIRWHGEAGTLLEVAVTDVVGKQVYQTNATAVADMYNTTAISLPELPAGVYLIRCVIGGEQFKAKIVFL